MMENIALFAGMQQKMGWLQSRQRVLSQNITNSDTPGYQSMDIKAPNFGKTMAVYEGGLKSASMGKLNMSTTASTHLGAQDQGSAPVRMQANRERYDVTPTGNSVSMEEQMMSASQNAVDYQLITNLYNKNLDILRSAMRR
jgi:flagellar basal-body rod protein FlgB